MSKPKRKGKQSKRRKNRKQNRSCKKIKQHRKNKKLNKSKKIRIRIDGVNVALGRIDNVIDIANTVMIKGKLIYPPMSESLDPQFFDVDSDWYHSIPKFENTDYCLMCRSKERLTKHHIVPKRYNPRFLLGIMRNKVTLCRGCHDCYEEFAKEGCSADILYWTNHFNQFLIDKIVT